MSNVIAIRNAMENALGDLAILSGDIVGPSNASWQDVAGTAAVNLRHLASLLDAARRSSALGGFPSPVETLDHLGAIPWTDAP